MANPEHLEILKQGAEIWNQWRKDNPEVIPDLSEVDLSEEDLSEVDLSKADLHGADLSKANLCAAYFHITSLRQVALREADLTRARFGGTLLSATDLSETEGLETVRHLAPSSISIDTIYRSSGKIPEVFLRGCGIPETFITFAKSLIGKPLEFYSCFISYSHADKSFARRLHDQLQACGIRCWLDEQQILPGDKVFDEVDRGIQLWDKVTMERGNFRQNRSCER
jgi:TIR domain-containing protein/pentapeptide repeat protein